MLNFGDYLAWGQCSNSGKLGASLSFVYPEVNTEVPDEPAT